MRCYSLLISFVLIGFCFPLVLVEQVLGHCFFLLPYVLSVGDQVSSGYLAAVLHVAAVFLLLHPECLVEQIAVRLHWNASVCNTLQQFLHCIYICIDTLMYLMTVSRCYCISLCVSLCASLSLFLIFVPRSAENASVAMATDPKGKS